MTNLPLRFGDDPISEVKEKFR